jgi:VCBS repeat-containing protein
VLQHPGYTGASLVVVDGVSGAKIASISLVAEDLALDPVRGFIYAVKDFPRFLYVVDTATNALVQTIALSDFFGSPAINSRTQRLYLNSNDTMDIYDATTRTKAGAVTGLLAPAGGRFNKTLASLDDRAKVFKVNRGATASETGANTVEVIQDIGALNEPPVAHSSSVTTDEDVALSGTLNATDENGDTLTYTLITNGTLGTAAITNSTTGAFTYTPHPEASGVDRFTFKASDGTSESAAATVTVTIAAVNDPPVAAGDSAAIDEDVRLSGNVLSNDSDADGGPLSARLVSGPAHGVVALNADGSYVYTPARDFNGVDGFTYVANDGAANSAPATVTIAIAPVNDAPVAVNDAAATNEEVAVSGNVLANDSDVDSSALSVRLVTETAHGTIVLNADGSFTYTPTQDFNGVDSFTYVASDGAADSAPASAVIAVNPINDAPIAYSDLIRTMRNTPATGVLRATDVDGDALHFSIVLMPSNGTVTLDAATGAFVYKPNKNFFGVDVFAFRARDASAESNTGWVVISVEK